MNNSSLSIGGAVTAAALVLVLLIRELPLRTTIAPPSATPAEPARQ